MENENQIGCPCIFIAMNSRITYMQNSLYRRHAEIQLLLVQCDDLLTVPSVHATHTDVYKQFRALTLCHEHVAVHLRYQLIPYLATCKDNVKPFLIVSQGWLGILSRRPMSGSSAALQSFVGAYLVPVSSISSGKDTTILHLSPHCSVRFPFPVLSANQWNLVEGLLLADKLLGKWGYWMIKGWSNRNKAEAFREERNKNGFMQKVAE